MSDYRVIVVGTDGSDTSLRAVEKAAEIAGDAKAKLIVASVQSERPSHDGPDPEQPKDESYHTQGSAPVYDLLRDAADRARQAGAADVEERLVEGVPADALIALAKETGADLLVVGNVGLNSVVGRLVGSVPQIVRRRATTEVLVVETKD